MRICFLSCVVVSSLLLCCTGCGEPKLDGSSEEALKKSADTVKASISDNAKKEKFEEAVGTLMLAKVVWGGGDQAASEKKLKETFDGKTADEVIAEAEKVQAGAKAEMEKLIKE